MARKLPKLPVRSLVSVLILLAALVFAGHAMAQSDDTRPRLLFIVESDSRLPLVKALHVEYLDMLRFNDPRELELNRTFLVERYGGLGLDAVMVLGAHALSYVVANREAFAPGAPIVYGGFGEAGMMTALSGQTLPDVSGVISPFDFRSTLDLALTVQPDAPEIVVITGSARFDRQWRSAFTSVIADTYRDLPVRFLPEATADEYLAEARTLDPGAIVLLLSVNLDAEGRRFLPVQFAEALAEASAAPVWSLYETQIGKGIVGGTVEDLSSTGREIGKMLRTAIAGDPLAEPVKVTAVPTVDWRAMQRHGLDLGRLPKGSRILFYEPTLWEQYRVFLIAVAAVVAAQTATIFGLVFHRRRYFRTQASLDLERSQLIHVSRNLRLGQLSASLAHEINQPLAAIQANAEAGARIAGRTPPDLVEIGAIFQDINNDVRRAASTIANLRRLMVKGEVTMERLDLNEIVRATLALAQSELANSGVQVRQVLSPGPVEVSGNGPQLQQIVLNLVLNASEAMDGLPEAAKTLRVSTVFHPGGAATLTVEDAGPGIPPDQREEVFRPFVSSKPLGLGVGLAICRSIAAAHGGSLAFVDPEAAGARIVLTLPPGGART
ncbi:MAG: ATP-binding protein [Rhodobacterales bacterium]|nr:ATP-binding protein [Rhodobacterales bacterium]